MKTSKPTLKKSDQGECGVWLDTAELKGKANQVEYQIITNITYQHDAMVVMMTRFQTDVKIYICILFVHPETAYSSHFQTVKSLP